MKVKQKNWPFCYSFPFIGEEKPAKTKRLRARCNSARSPLFYEDLHEDEIIVKLFRWVRPYS